MAHSLKICEFCGIEYKQCESCEKTYSKIYFAWRTKYCSPKCFMRGMENVIESGEKMRIQYESKTYIVKEYNLSKDEFITSNDIKLKKKDIEGFILEPKDFEEILNYTPKKVVSKEIKNEEVDK